MNKKGKAAETEKRIREMLEKRLQKLGPITSNDAWHICKSTFGYSVVCNVFRKIMNEMKDADKADNIRNGLWWIHKNKYSK